MKTNKFCSWHVIVYVVCILSPTLARAWMRVPYADPDIVKRADLIVVAHLKEGSLVSERRPNRMEEYRVLLIVSKVIKGHMSVDEVPAIIHYGLTPVVGGYVKTERTMVDVRNNRPDYPKDAVEVFDTGNSSVSFEPIVDDIRKDHLWFLRIHQAKNQGSRGSDNTDLLGVWDPEDIQPLEFTPYFEAFLTDRLIEQLTKLSTGQSLLSTRSQNYLVHLDIKKASEEPDLTRRAVLLLPFCLYTNDKMFKPTQSEALNEMRRHCGKAGAARLVQIFNDPIYAVMRIEIMNVWEETEYQESLPVVTELLKTENRFWIEQGLSEQGLITSAQRESVARVTEALLVLNRLASPTSKQIVEETQRVWNAPERHRSSGDIPEICDAVLRSISEAVDRAEDGVDPRRIEERKKSDLEVENARQIVFACTLYANDHHGTHPKDLKELVPMYTAYEKIFISPLSNDPTKPGYQYFAGSEQDPPKKIVLQSFFATSNGKRTIVYKDGIAERKYDP